MFSMNLAPDWLTNKESSLIFYLLIIYFVGIIGLGFTSWSYFVLLTPLNLLVSLVIVLLNHKKWSLTFSLILGIIFMAGWVAEVIGVQTGVLFGSYEYTSVLGPSLFGVPLVLGVMWISTTYCAAMLMNEFFPAMHFIMKALIGAVLMVFLDLLIEPFAIHYGLWQWSNDEIPIQNFIGWFIVAFPLLLLFFYKFPNTFNKVGIALFIIQILFFLSLGAIDFLL